MKELIPMLKELGIDWCLIGHSERRTYDNETNEKCNLKIKALIANDMVPLYCVGETLAEFEAGRTKEVVGAQVREGLAEVAYVYDDYKYTKSLCLVENEALMDARNIWSIEGKEEDYCAGIDLEKVTNNINFDTLIVDEEVSYYLFIVVAGTSVELTYVHELQHALRLCGQNDLADNFKF